MRSVRSVRKLPKCSGARPMRIAISATSSKPRSGTSENTSRRRREIVFWTRGAGAAAMCRCYATSEEHYMKTVAEQYIEEGLQKGLQLALCMVFEERFGPASPAVMQRIENSSPAEVEHWMRRILTARSPEELFE